MGDQRAPEPPVCGPEGAGKVRNTGLVVGIVVGVVVLFLILGALAGIFTWLSLNNSADEAPVEVIAPEGQPAEPPAVAPATPVPATDPLAEATVVLERYLAADLGNDGAEMQKYLGGQARARFVPEVVGQEDLRVHSKRISSGQMLDENTARFLVQVEWSPEGSSEVRTDLQGYVLQRTDEGWLIVSTPEYQG